MAEALYRKYRPQVFEDVVGQEPIERTLKNAIMQDKVSHAYLFTGPRGTGKTTTARLLAKALLCQQGPTPDPDGTCEDCELIAEGVHPDVYELDAASRTGVENVREEIISRVQFAPTRGRYKVYIIDEVHMLSTAAFNALLKTLEEPPSHVVFVLCTTDPQKVPETIHSRCQRFDFRRIAPESMVSRLGAICIAEDVEFEGEALDLIAHRAEGGLRNALTSLEQIIAFENGRITLAGAERLLGSIDSNDMAEIISYIGKRDIANCFRWTAAYVETGADLAQFVRDMAEHVRNLYVLSIVGEDVELEIGETSRHELIGELQWFGPDRLSRLLGVLGDLSAELKTSSNPRLAFEIALTRMVRPDSDLTIESLAERIEALESGYSAVAHVLPGEPMRRTDAVQGGADAVFSGMPTFGVTDAAPSTAQSPVPSPMISAPVSAPAPVPAPAPVFEPAPSAAVVSAAAEQPGRQYAAQPAQRQQTTAAHSAGAAATSTAQPRQASQAYQAGQAGQASAQPTQQSQQTQPTSAAGDNLAVLENPAALQRIWQAALSALKKQKQAYGVLFMNSKARYDAATKTLRVVFPEESAFAFNAVQKPDVQDALAASLAHAAGSSVPFSYEKAGSAPIATKASSSSSVAAERSGARQAESAVSHAQVAQAASTPAQEPSAQPAPAQASPAQAAPMQAAPAQTLPEQAIPAQAIPAQAAPEQAIPAQAAPAQAAPPAMPPSSNPPFEAQPAPTDYPPYDQVPYEEVPYESVPYEEFDSQPFEPDYSRGAENYAPPSQPFASQAGGNANTSAFNSAAAGSPGAETPVPDASTSASPADAHLTPTGAIEENPADVEAMLQAGFGGGVIFSEVEE